ncbi:uncharacterized protein LOC126661604 [Mercurialis annua]|uniref:uncharacterized protein LOC126661604 n=1 Tax=Mercurialis annua TaxID=3986 RepID=UPI00215F19B6|nr:uncharacterized protein LOC126661604 [Mercurialis annua]
MLSKVLEKLDKIEQRELDARQREKNQASTIHHLETQISQMALILQGRPQGGLPSTTENNPREQIKAVELRRGRNLEKANGKKHVVEEDDSQVVIDVASSSQELPKDFEEVAIDVEEPYVRPPPPPFVPKVPFPSRLRKAPDNQKFHKFLEIFKKLQINLSLADALREMPQYGASINLMPLTIFRTLCGEQTVKNTSMVLQLADHSLKRPYGIVEDVLVKECLMILGRPFMNTGRALIDVHGGKLTLRIDEETVEFDMKKVMRGTIEEEECMRIDLLDEVVEQL